MEIEFKDAANGERTCRINGIHLHSSYNPSREADRFAETAEVSFTPDFVLVTEPALSFCIKPLRNRFPNARLVCVRYCDSFKESDILWDKVFHVHSKTKPSLFNKALAEEFFDYMGDDGLASCAFLSWKPSERIFAEEYKFCWEEIKKSVLKSRSVLATRSFFAARWAKNALRFCLFAKNTATIKRGTSAVLVCASGPSLSRNFDEIKKFRSRFFLVAVSSAITPLLSAGIIPDLCISTDGGYWAKLHLAFSLARNRIPLALPGEASCFAANFMNVPVVPLYYGDGCSEDILKSSKYFGARGLRNGSVSGTAAHLSLAMTDGYVFYCGLDLSSSKGYVHSQPNELEKNDCRFDFRLSPLETRIAAQHVKSSVSSMDIYRSWFASTDFKGRLYRLNREPYESRLGKIQDIDWKKFETLTQNHGLLSKPEISETEQNFSFDERILFLEKTVEKNISNEEWIKNAFPAEYIVAMRSKGQPDETEKALALEAEMKKFKKNVLRAIGMGEKEI